MLMDYTVQILFICKVKIDCYIICFISITRVHPLSTLLCSPMSSCPRRCWILTPKPLVHSCLHKPHQGCCPHRGTNFPHSCTPQPSTSCPLGLWTPALPSSNLRSQRRFGAMASHPKKTYTVGHAKKRQMTINGPSNLLACSALGLPPLLSLCAILSRIGRPGNKG